MPLLGCFHVKRGIRLAVRQSWSASRALRSKRRALATRGRPKRCR
jgi:hypothetical protein